ncbi:MAG: hypothetical protein SP4CHLAM5_01200 [Chlamydiia bacterium]|nr:hypothetical protein [Chlamydiia bacterium]MCH9617996.1 hypothetical protein [Chlamydiia bacterium]MCH9623679.1 hypothetical protein [Chlamydiia bacterium]
MKVPSRLESRPLNTAAVEPVKVFALTSFSNKTSTVAIKIISGVGLFLAAVYFIKNFFYNKKDQEEKVKVKSDTEFDVATEKQNQLFERVSNEVRKIGRKPSQVKVWTEIAVFFSSISNSEKANEALKQAQDCHTPYDMHKVHRSGPGTISCVVEEVGYIAKAQAQTGDIKGAIKTIDSIPTESSHLGDYGRIELKAKIGDRKGSKEEINKLVSPEEKDTGLGKLAEVQINQGAIDEAKATIKLIKNDFLIAHKQYMLIVRQFKDDKNIDKALQAIQCSDDRFKDDLLSQVIRILAESNQIAEAKQVLAKIKDKQKRVFSEIVIAEFNEESGDIKEIIENGKQIGLELNKTFRASLLKVQLKRKIKSGDIEAAKVLAKGCNQCSAKDEALLAVMQWCIERDNTEAAKAMAEIIPLSLNGAHRNIPKDEALRLLAGAYARSGNFSAARDAIDRMSTEEERIKAEFEVYKIVQAKEEVSKNGDRSFKANIANKDGKGGGGVKSEKEIPPFLHGKIDVSSLQMVTQVNKVTEKTFSAKFIKALELVEACSAKGIYAYIRTTKFDPSKPDTADFYVEINKRPKLLNCMKMNLRGFANQRGDGTKWSFFHGTGPKPTWMATPPDRLGAANIGRYVQQYKSDAIQELAVNALKLVETVSKKAGYKEIWFNTHGFGVSFLHLRVDTSCAGEKRPKYYFPELRDSEENKFISVQSVDHIEKISQFLTQKTNEMNGSA